MAAVEGLLLHAVTDPSLAVDQAFDELTAWIEHNTEGRPVH